MDSAPALAPAKTTTTLDELPGLVGQRLGISAPLLITQERINTFAEATDDHQWIHVDPVRAASGPFGTTIAHGYLTLSLLAGLSAQVFEVADASAIVNYGLDKVRFPAPVPVGSQVQLEFTLTDVAQIPGGLQAAIHAVVHVAGQGKPAVAATQLLRLYR